MNNTIKKIISFFIIFALLLSLNTNTFAKRTYTVTFKATTGSFSHKHNSKKSKIKMKYKKNEKRGYAPKISRSGYAFKGWYTRKKGGKRYSYNTRINKNVKLYPQWLKRYKTKTKYFDYFGYTFKSDTDIKKAFPGSKKIKDSGIYGKYYPFNAEYKSSYFLCLFDYYFDDTTDEKNITYNYYLKKLKCKIKKIVNIKKRRKYSTFLHKLTGSKQTDYLLNKKRHILTFAYKTYKYYDEESKTIENYYILWNIKLDKKNRVKPSSKVSFTDSEDNIVS